MASKYASQKGSDINSNRHCLPERDINILLLGPTGVGKSTLINAFANYLINDTLEEAIKDEMQVIIPSFFTLTTPDTFDEKTITLGNMKMNMKSLMKWIYRAHDIVEVSFSLSVIGICDSLTHQA
jgi:DNA replication protein DnaC